jgi:hypothetical protein
MTHDEYERVYAEALNVVRAKIPKVGQPETSADGVRILRIGGAMLCDDEFVFRLAWGVDAAQEIMSRKPKS